MIQTRFCVQWSQIRAKEVYYNGNFAVKHFQTTRQKKVFNKSKTLFANFSNASF